MKEMVGRGVPAVVVSHQLERIASLCNSAILLTKGRIAFQGPPPECIAAYARHQSASPVPDEPGGGLRLDSITLATPQPVPSGDRAEVVIAGVAPPEREELRQVVGVRVRSLQTGEILFATGTKSHEIALPTGPFELRVELQMNVPPGVYAVESTTLGWQREREPRNGPATLVHVSGGRGFWGQVQMNCVMRASGRPGGGGAAGG